MFLGPLGPVIATDLKQMLIKLGSLSLLPKKIGVTKKIQPKIFGTTLVPFC